MSIRLYYQCFNTNFAHFLCVAPEQVGSPQIQKRISKGSPPSGLSFANSSSLLSVKEYKYKFCSFFVCGARTSRFATNTEAD
jgi:hypothetical protein